MGVSAPNRSGGRRLALTAGLLLAPACVGSQPAGRFEPDPKPEGEPVLVEGLPVRSDLDRTRVIPITPKRRIAVPENRADLGSASQLLPDGTLYRLELMKGAALRRFDIRGEAVVEGTPIPLVPPQGQTLATGPLDYVRYRTSTLGLVMGEDRKGWAWWQEDTAEGRVVVFRIESESAALVQLGKDVGTDPKPYNWRGFDLTPVDRTTPYRFVTGGGFVEADARARLRPGGFVLALLRPGAARAEALVQTSAADIPHLDASLGADGRLSLILATQSYSRCEAVRLLYDPAAKAWVRHEPLLAFRGCQSLAAVDLGGMGALIEMGMPWNTHEKEGDTGLYYVPRPGVVEHLLTRTRTRDTKAVPMKDGFLAVFQDEASLEGHEATFLLRYRTGQPPTLYRFDPGQPCPLKHLVALGPNRFAVSFCDDEILEFEVE